MCAACLCTLEYRETSLVRTLKGTQNQYLLSEVHTHVRTYVLPIWVGLSGAIMTILGWSDILADFNVS